MLNYTTTIKAEKSIGEIQNILGKAGVSQITTDYQPGLGLAVGISFAIKVNGSNIYFQLPANWKGVQKAIRRKTNAKKYQSDEHAINVCWRVIKDWIEAQVALVQADQADMATVFLSHALMQNGKTISHNFLNEPHGKKLLLNPGI